MADFLSTYVKQINRTPLLTREQEHELAIRVAAGDTAARDHLVRANLRLVVHICHRYKQSGLPMEDLIQEGNLGIMRAAQDFDPHRGCRFSTYAIPWIRAYIRRALHDTVALVRKPSYLYWLRTCVRRAAAHGKTFPLTSRQVKYLGLLDSTNAMTGYDLKLILDRESSLPDAETLVQLQQALRQLEPQHRQVLRLRFGLSGKRLSLREIGERWQLSKERVRQIEKQALAALRQMI